MASFNKKTCVITEKKKKHGVKENKYAIFFASSQLMLRKYPIDSKVYLECWEWMV